MINTQESREDDNILDTDTDLEHDTFYDTEEAEKKINKNLTTAIVENKQDNEVVDENLIMMLLRS